MSRPGQSLTRRSVLAAAPLALLPATPAFAQIGRGRYRDGQDVEVRVAAADGTAVADGTKVGVESDLLGQSTERTVQNGRVGVGAVKKSGLYLVRVIHGPPKARQIDVHSLVVSASPRPGVLEVAFGLQAVPANKVPAVKAAVLTVLSDPDTYTQDRLRRALKLWVEKDAPGQAAGVSTVVVLGVVCTAGAVVACPLAGQAFASVGMTAMVALTGRLLDVLAEDRLITAADATRLKDVLRLAGALVKVIGGKAAAEKTAAAAEAGLDVVAEATLPDGPAKWALQIGKDEVGKVRLLLKLSK